MDKWAKYNPENLRLKTYKSGFAKRQDQSMEEIIRSCPPEVAAAIIPFLQTEKIDLDLLHGFLITNEDKLENNNYASYFKKLVSLYDRLKWGW